TPEARASVRPAPRPVRQVTEFQSLYCSNDRSPGALSHYHDRANARTNAALRDCFVKGDTNMKATVGMVALLGMAAACSDDHGLRTLTNDKPIIVAPLYVDQNGNPIGAQTPDSLQIDKVVGATPVPVIGPDGHAVTWGQFRSATGVAQLTCEP